MTLTTSTIIAGASRFINIIQGTPCLIRGRWLCGRRCADLTFMESRSTACGLSCGCPVWRPRLGPDAVKSRQGIIKEQAVITLSPSRGPPRRRPPPRRLLVRPGVEPRRRTSLDLTPITHTSEHDARRRRLPARPFARSPRDCRCLSTPPTQINFLRSPERGRIPTGTVSRVRPGSPRCLFLRVLPWYGTVPLR